MTEPEVALERIAQRAGDLYSLPAVAMQVLELTRNPRVDTALLRDTIEKDPALTVRILRTVNSSLFGLSRRISDLNQALALLGVKPLKLLVLGFNLPSGLFVGIAAETLGRYWRHTLTKAVVAREISESVYREPGDDAFMVGLLQDLGEMVLLQELGQPYARFLDRAAAHPIDLLAAEREAIGFDHTQLTARLLERWALPPAMVEAVAVGGPPSRLAAIVQRAELLARLLIDGRLDLLKPALAAQEQAASLTPVQLDELAATLAEKIDALAEVLNLQLPDGLDYRDVLLRAHRQLATVAAETAESLVTAQALAPSPEEQRELRAELEEVAAAVAQVTAGRKAPRCATTTTANSGGEATETRDLRTAGAAAPLRSSRMPRASQPTSEAQLVAALQQAVAACRQARCPLSLMLVAPCADDAAADLERLGAVCAAVDHRGRACVPYGMGWAVVLPDCERRQAIDWGHHVVAMVRPTGAGQSGAGQPAAAVSAAESAARGFPLGSHEPPCERPLCVGVATVSLPPRNFPPEALLDGAKRCLSGSQASGGGVVKSLEIY